MSRELPGNGTGTYDGGGMAWHGMAGAMVRWADGAWLARLHGPKGGDQGAKELAKGAKGLGQGGIQLPRFVLPNFSKKMLNFKSNRTWKNNIQ